MAVAETAELAVRLSLDSSKFNNGMRQIDGRLSRLGSKMKTLGRGIAAGLGVTAAAGAVIFARALGDGVHAAEALDAVMSQTASTLATRVGRASGATAKQVRDIAVAFEDVNAQVDELDIQKLENLLITFGVKGSALKAVTGVVLDAATATGRSVESVAQSVGKAISGNATALSRLIGKLTPGEERLLKAAKKTTSKLDDQAAVVEILRKRFGGSFAKAGDTAAGKVAKLNDKIDDLKRTMGTALLPVISKVADRLSSWLDKPETIATVQKLGDTIAGLFTDQNLNTVATGIETAASAVSTAISAFNSLPPEIKALAIGAFAINKVTGGAVTGAAGAFAKILGSGLQRIFAANVTVIGTNVTGAGAGAAGAPGIAPVKGAGGVTGLVAAGAAGLSGAAVAGLLKEVGRGIADAISSATGMDKGALTDLFDLANQSAFGPFATLADLSGTIDKAGKELAAIGDFLTGKQGPVVDKQAALAADTLAESRATANAVAASAKTQASALVSFRASERASETNNTLQTIANGKLGVIAGKKTNFQTKVNVSVTQSVSVSDVAKKTKYRQSVAHVGMLTAS